MQGGSNMISSYKKLTGRYLKANIKRTILTLIGIILSVALISSIGLFIKGTQAAEIEQTRHSYGSFHLMFKSVNDELISKITNNPKVARYGFYKQGEETALDKNMTASEIATTDEALALSPYVIKKGKMPQNENDVAVEEWALGYLDKDVKIGDKIKFNNKEYNLSGILENSVSNQYNNKVIYLTKTKDISKEGSILLVEISSKANLRKAIDELKQLSEKDEVAENGPLLMRLGAAGKDSGMGEIYLIVGIIITIVVVATIAVIYNSFQISVVERIREFGLLRAVGATPRQIKKIVLKEASILACIGVPIGLLFGVIAIMCITAAFKLIGGDSVLLVKLDIDPFVMAVSLVIGLISIYISAILPSIFAGRISPLVAISSRTSITKEKIKKSKHRLTHKFFGFEGAMAAKNIKRNRKRYRITVFSIIISVVLFVAFKSFMDMTLTISDSPNLSRDIHFTVYRSGDRKSAENIDDKLLNNLKAINSVDTVYKRYGEISFDAVIGTTSEVKEVQAIGSIYNKTTLNGTEKTLMQAYTEVYDAAALEEAKKYVEAGSIDIQKLNQENGVILINKNTIYNGNTKKKYVGPVANLKVGDEIDLQYIDFEKGQLEFGKGNVKKVKVMAILSSDPFDFYGSEAGLKLITTEEAAKSIIGDKSLVIDRFNIKIKDVKDEEIAKESIEDAIRSTPSLRLVNNIDSNRRSKSTMLMVQILIYGFVIVVSLISCVNIINTLTTNIILRKREFAALKSIGLTQRGLKKMIVLEGLLYGVVGSIYGSIVGCGLSFLMYYGFGGLREFSWPIPWDAMAIASASALIIGYIAVLSPLSRIKKENLIEAIREE
jgi:putative ABC transport system permease protein